MEITSRQQAISDDLNKYFTGLPCTNGHISERYTKSGSCKRCIEESNREKKGFDRWNAAQCDAQDEEKLSNRYLEQHGLEAWTEWKFKRAQLALDAAASRDALTGRFKQFLANQSCRHRLRVSHPDGSYVCRKCGEEVAEPIKRPAAAAKKGAKFLPG